MLRIGHGYDVHAFTAGDHIVLGGVRIPHTQAFKAHSDGDVLLHAICDALLGALALGDIGQHFPDTASEFTGIDSRILLQRVYALVQAEGYELQNLDSTIIAQAPKMAGHIVTMRQNIAADLTTNIQQVNVKATTTEKLGFAGRQEGIAAHSVVLLMSTNS